MHSHKLEPEYLGPLADAPATDTGTHVLFPGEDRFLSGSACRKRLELVQALDATLERCLEDGERVVYVAPANQRPGLFESIGLGVWFYHLHRTALVFTDRRLVEVLLEGTRNRPATRIRSWAWSGLSRVKFGFGALKLKPDAGRAASWRISLRPDRKVIKKLLLNIRAKVVHVQGVENAHRWLCPTCGAANPPSPPSCGGCRTAFRTPGVATALSLALPGGGLFYAGRPVLGTLDLLGELMLFGIVALSLAAAPGIAEGVAAAAVGLLLLVLTKVESVHLSRMLVRRTVPETGDRRRTWKRIGVGGAIASSLAVIGAVALTGALAGSLVRDLEFGEGERWTGTRAAGEFLAYDVDQRSQWTSGDGSAVFVAAHPLGIGEEWASFRESYVATIEQDGLEPILLDDEVPTGFAGFRCYVPVEDDDGQPYYSLNYMLYDDESTAVHHVYTFVEPERFELRARELSDLVQTATWIDAVEPTL
ncbi:MAG TPA: hypothetical protein VD788_08315 [Candidatus Polarisedimenticolaceae bacterium]|nr:hypothetical protein [Candidatus Polarisedimenticolaceae bacterium]